MKKDRSMRKTIDLQLIEQAQSGRQEALSTLSELARDRVYVFVYRLTLDQHLAEDLAQETILEMVRSISRLTFEHVNFFRAWLRRTALGKVQHHYRVQGNKRVQSKTTVNDDCLREVRGREDSGLDKLIHDELSKSVFDAMGALNFAYRSILTLRCFEQMTYPQIAAATGQTELQARIQFFRAKQSLKRQLLRRGHGRDHFLAALGAYGAITAGMGKDAAAATTVSEASLSVTGATVCLSLLASKAGVVAIIVVLAGLTIGGKHVLDLSRSSGPRQAPGLRWSYNTFADPARVIGAADPDNNGWRVFTLQHAQATMPAGGLDTIAARRRTQNPLLLELPERHWIHVAFAGPLVDGPGADILVDARRFGGQPRIFVTDGGAAEVEIPRTSTLTTAGGFDFSGYDLESVEIPFEPQGVRVEGCGAAGQGNCLELWVIRARIDAG
jgi:RNA polymerase sigma-70 factor (ECF subfamily)